MDTTLQPDAARIESGTYGALLKLAWPIVVSRSTQVVVGLSDALMVASLGESALAATTTGGFNMYALLILPMGICFIISSFSSQLFGRGDANGARRYGFYGLALALATQVFCIATIPGIGWALGWFDHAPDVLAGMTAYLAVRTLSGGAAVGSEALASYYGGIGNTQLPMRAAVLAMVANIALNAVFIHGAFGIPAMGVVGAAWASVLAAWLGFAAIFAVFIADGRRLGTVVPQLHLHELWRMLRFGLPAGLNWFLEFFAFNFFVNVVVAGLGTTTLAAFMTAMQINSASFMPAFGVASAGAILVGQHIGAGLKNEVPRLVRMTFLVTATWQGVVGVIYLAAPELLFGPFASGDESGALLAAGAMVLMYSAAWQLFDSAATTLAEALRAAGDTTFTLWARVVLAWAFFVPGSWLSVHVFEGGMGSAVAWMVGYLGVLAGVLWLRFRGGAWRRLDLVGSEVPPLPELVPEALVPE